MFPKADFDLRVIAPTIARILKVESPGGSEVGPLDAVLNTLPDAQRLALIVLDGFGSALWKYALEEVPTLNKIGEINGVEISSVIPSLTYVCLATMLTGISPKAHGVTDLEGAVYAADGVETLFDTVKRSGRKTLLGAHEKGVMGLPLERFADWAIIVEDAVDKQLYYQVPQLVAEHKPDFVFLHLIDVDEAGHAHGPYSPEVKKAATEMDISLNRLFRLFVEEDYALLALADHGMHPVTTTESGGQLGNHDGSVMEDRAVPLVWASSEELAGAI